MLPKINRLKKRKDFEEVFRKGKSYKEQVVYIKVVSNKLRTSRFGFIVSKKISKKAVVRNKIKRRLRELVRINLKRIKSGIDGVLVALPGIEKKEFYELEEIIERLFKKAGIFQG